MLAPISQYKFLQRKHVEAPLFAERDRFLSHLESIGACRRELSLKAAYLQHIVRIMRLDSMRAVTIDEIHAAAEIWASDESSFRRSKKLQGSPVYFKKVAVQWFRFLGCLPVTPKPAFYDLLSQFCLDEIKLRGLSSRTVAGYRFRIAYFLKWLGLERQGSLASLCLRDVDDFLALQRQKCSTATIVAYCQALRTFCRYAQSRGLCPSGLPAGIQSPRLSKYKPGHLAPTWTEARRLLRAVGGTNPLDLRAKAMILLFTVYGLRNSEVCDLRLADFDWRQETFGIRRAKRGGIQQYRIQYEVGDAILRYLQHSRPHTPCRHLFVGAVRPFGPVTPGAMWQIVASRMRVAKVTSEHIGPHALRHACATRLLERGVSMLDIADFLGHQNPRCVGIYARYDTRRLKKIAAFSLRGAM